MITSTTHPLWLKSHLFQLLTTWLLTSGLIVLKIKKKTFVFRFKLRLVYCTGVWLLDSSSGVLCSNALLKIQVSNTQDSQGSNMFFHTSYSLSLNLILLINNFSVTSVQRCADVDCQCPLANTSSKSRLTQWQARRSPSFCYRAAVLQLFWSFIWQIYTEYMSMRLNTARNI